MLQDKIFYCNINNEIYQVKVEKCFVRSTIYEYYPFKQYGRLPMVALQIKIASIGTFLWKANYGWCKIDGYKQTWCGNNPIIRLDRLFTSIEDAISNAKQSAKATQTKKPFSNGFLHLHELGICYLEAMDVMRRTMPQAFLWRERVDAIGMCSLELKAYKWNGVEAVLASPKSASVDHYWTANSYGYLMIDLVDEVAYPSEDENLNAYYETEEECADNNHVKVHTF